MKSQFIAAVAAAGLLLGSASAALAATMPKDTGGTPGNGSAAVKPVHNYGGAAANGSAKVSHDYGGSAANGKAKKKASH